MSKRVIDLELLEDLRDCAFQFAERYHAEHVGTRQAEHQRLDRLVQVANALIAEEMPSPFAWIADYSDCSGGMLVMPKERAERSRDMMCRVIPVYTGEDGAEEEICRLSAEVSRLTEELARMRSAPAALNDAIAQVG